MKLSIVKLSIFKISRNQCLLFGLIVAILAMFYLKKKTTIIEGNFVNDINIALAQGVTTFSGLLNQEGVHIATPDAPAATIPNTVTVTKRPPLIDVISDNCSTQSLLSSDYKHDICSTYEGDYQAIDLKCKSLSNTNCNLTNCCVLLNGNKCVAGNVNGPTFLTDQGNEIDYEYYMYRGKTHPENYNPSPSSGYIKNCSMYSSNSANISKACMVQLFNDAGCTNPKPNALINDDSLSEYSALSKDYIKSDLQNAVKVLKSKIKSGNDDSRILCDGARPNNPCDKFDNNSVGVTKECMIKMFNEAGCSNKNPSFIDDNYVSSFSSMNKKRVKFEIKEAAKLIKQSAIHDITGSDIQVKNETMCLGTPQQRTQIMLSSFKKIDEQSR
jgi:hypothetical protein